MMMRKIMILKNKNAKIAMLIALSIACCSLDPTHAFSSTTSHGSRRFRISSSSATSRSSLSQHVLGTETSGSKMKININRVTATRQQAIVQHQRRWQQLPSLSMSSVEGDFDPEALARAREDVKAGSIKARLRALYKFTRPHTIRGTILGSIAGTVRALLDTPGALANARWGTMLPRAFVGMFALLLGNAFIVGINQIYDQDIDKMNKPFLPVASGEMSNRAAWLAVLVSGSVGPLIVHKFFPPLLFQLYTAGLVLGGVYSVPPIRTKKNPILAGLTIAIVRGFLLNFGVYYAVKDAFGSAFSWSPKVAFVARFMTIFATVIAVTKDLPDIEGDKTFQIDTFATKLGVKRIAQGATFLLMMNYLHAVATGLLAVPGTFQMIPMVVGHLVLAMLLLQNYTNLDAESMPSIKLYYKRIWDLFYLEYALYTLI